MKIKLDENLPIDASIALSDAGHDVQTVFDEDLAGRPDEYLVQKCRDENRALITLDSDFSDIRIYPPSEYFGIIVLRLKSQDKANILAVLSRLIKIISEEIVERHLLIVDEKRIRIRS